MLFVSGAGWPDYVFYDRKILTAGDGGVLEAGWFDRHCGFMSRHGETLPPEGAACSNPRTQIECHIAVSRIG